MNQKIVVFAGAIIIALFMRLFIVEAFKIPSASMVPTLMIGDHIFVNKLAYVRGQDPKRGDVIVFIRPDAENQHYIKRVVGVPGDVIRFSGEDLYINNEKQVHTPLIVTSVPGNMHQLLVQDNPNWTTLPFVNRWKSFNFFNEQLGTVNHLVQYEQDMFRPEREFTVPEGQIFTVGDNRDNSSDSREWGAVPMEDVKGRAMFVWLSWDYDRASLRWDRIGHWVQ